MTLNSSGSYGNPKIIPSPLLHYPPLFSRLKDRDSFSQHPWLLLTVMWHHHGQGDESRSQLGGFAQTFVSLIIRVRKGFPLIRTLIVDVMVRAVAAILWSWSNRHKHESQHSKDGEAERQRTWDIRCHWTNTFNTIEPIPNHILPDFLLCEKNKYIFFISSFSITFGQTHSLLTDLQKRNWAQRAMGCYSALRRQLLEMPGQDCRRGQVGSQTLRPETASILLWKNENLGNVSLECARSFSWKKKRWSQIQKIKPTGRDVQRRQTQRDSHLYPNCCKGVQTKNQKIQPTLLCPHCISKSQFSFFKTEAWASVA